MKQLALTLAPPPEPALDNFFAGQNGEVVAHLRSLVAGRDAERSVYLWGNAGSGRTHLLRATIAALEAAGLACLYVAPGAGVPESAAELRAVAIDDVEKLDARDQRAFFNLYNRMKERSGIVLAAGDAAPARLHLRPELLTRLGWGLVYQMRALSDEEKILALKGHASQRSFDLPDGVADYLLHHLSRDLPSLISVLDALDRHSLETKRPITLPLLKDLLEPGAQSPR
ncbi:MAG TPA: DnaA regulatory inactivator Hda [Burkholderiales bacterium]|nr:DnaA regulatory inactivator Hda [Burkholderiales bacterium]